MSIHSTALPPSSITLQPLVASGLTANEMVNDATLILENNQIKFKNEGFLRKLCNCCPYYGSKAEQETQKQKAAECFEAYKKYLEVQYDAPILAKSLELTDNLSDIFSFHLSHARAINETASTLKSRYGDIKLFVLWLNWHKAYRELKDSYEDLFDRNDFAGDLPKKSQNQQSGDPIAPMATINDAELPKLFQMYHKILEQIPLEGITKEELLPIVHQAYSKLSRAKMADNPSYSILQEVILKAFKKKGVSIKDPPADTIPSQLKEEIEKCETINKLTSDHWQQLLSKKGDYMPPSHRPTPSLIYSVTQNTVDDSSRGSKNISKIFFSSTDSQGL